jgi:hypothetical protein
VEGTAGCKKAFANVIAALRPGVRFPQNVFNASWSNFLFFDADQLFFGNFIWVVKELLRIERAHSGCLVNLSRTSANFDEAACMCLDAATRGDDYEARLRAGSVVNAWLYDIGDDYGCASESGEWCIYCERQSEVAVIAIKQTELMKSIHVPLRMLGARSAENLWTPKPTAPVSKAGEQWRSRLAEQYVPSLERERFQWWTEKV